MPDKERFTEQVQRIQWRGIALVLTLALTSAHIALVWGQTGFWGDPGRWRHEVEWFVLGETLYRDFVWPFPPMALWLLGWTERIFGDSTTVLFAACSILTLLIGALYWKYCCVLLTDNIRAVAIIAPLGMLLALGYVQYAGEPMPSGAYSPAAPIGFLFLLIGLCGWISGRSVLTGIACGLAITTKHDFWLPAGLILMTMYLRRRHGAWTACVCAAGVVLAVIAVVVVQAGWSALPLILTGFGRARFQARSLPSWERVTAELAAFAMIAGVAMAALRRFRPAIVSLGLFVLFGGVLFAKSPNFGEFRIVFLAHQFPILGPVMLLAWAVRSGKSDLACLLGIALAARVRRGFEYTEWFSLLIELPLFALILYQQKAHRAAPLLAATAALIAILTYWQIGVGPLTHRNSDRQWVQTPKGPVIWSGAHARLYYAILPAIGNDHSPLFAFGYTGGFSYYFDRVNPSPSAEGLIFSGRDPQQLVNAIRAARPVLLESNYYKRTYAQVLSAVRRSERKHHLETLGILR